MYIYRTTPYRSPNSVKRRREVSDRGPEGVRPPCTGSRLGDLLSELMVIINNNNVWYMWNLSIMDTIGKKVSWL